MAQQSPAMRLLSKNLGFTLVELLVVIAIIAVLAALIVFNLSGARERTRDVQRKNDLAQMKKALRLYYNDYQSYPSGTSLGGTAGQSFDGCGSAGDDECEWGTSFSAGTGPTIYMNQIPIDPLNEGEYVYSYFQNPSNSDAFYLRAVLENPSDSAAAQSQTRCGISDAQPNEYYVCQD